MGSNLSPLESAITVLSSVGDDRESIPKREEPYLIVRRA
jgi:hypothetical protein